MLSQRIARSACFIAMNVDVQNNREILAASRSAFGRSLNELKIGGGALDFTPETDAAALERLNEIERLWFPLQRQISDFTREKSMDYDAVRAFSEEMNVLLQAADLYVEALEQKALVSESRTSPEQAKFVNLSGRQRMLMQRMGNEACLITMGYERGERPAQAEMKAAASLFNETAFHLTFGATVAEVQAASEDELLEENALLWQKWSLIEVLFRALEQGPLSDRELRELSWEVEAMVEELDTIVALYAAL